MRVTCGVTCLVLALGCSKAHSQELLIDDFDQGDFSHDFHNSQDAFIDTQTGLDPGHVAGGSRHWDFTYSGNTSLQTITVANGGGSFGVSWDHGVQPNITSTLRLGWGFFDPMSLDLSSLGSFQVFWHTTAENIPATSYSINLFDGSGNDSANFAPQFHANGSITFDHSDFSNPSFDWSAVVLIQFSQNYTGPPLALNAYYTDDIKAIPEPDMWPCGFLCLFWIRRKRTIGQ